MRYSKDTKTLAISVIMSVYNGDKFLRLAIDSILKQTFSDLEFIVIDDASTDETSEILKSYDDPRLIVITNTENIGLTKSLNKAFQIATGQFVARQDADDISHPDRLTNQIAFLDNHLDYALVGTHAVLIDEYGKQIDTIEVPSDCQAIASTLLTNNAFIHGSIMARKSAVVALGGYRENFRYTQDYDLWLRMSEYHTLANLPETLYSLRRLSNSISMIHFDRQLAFAFLAREFYMERKQSDFDSHNELDPEHPGELLKRKFSHLLPELKQEKYNLCLAYADESNKLNKKKIARRWLKQALENAPTPDCYYAVRRRLWLDSWRPLTNTYQRHIGWRFRE